MSTTSLAESKIDNICEEILEYYKEDKRFIPYVEKIIIKIKKFLCHKSNLDSFDKEIFVKEIIKRINNKRVKVKTHVGIIAAQSIGEPVTQLALSYFHKLSNDAITFNGLNELHNIIHNRMELDTISLYIKPGNYDIKEYTKMVNSFFYTSLNELVVDVAYDGFTLRIYLCSHILYAIKIHPLVIFNILKEYLEQTNSILHLWKATVDLENLYFEFAQPASKTLDWLDAHDIEYVVDNDMLCIYKPEIQSQAIQTEIPSSENSNQLLYNYFRENKINYDENEYGFIVDSNSVKLDTNDIETILEEVTITGTKGITKIETYNNNDQYIINVTGTNLDPLFNNKYIDPERSHYLVYSNSNEISFDQRKQNIFNQLKRIVDNGSKNYNYKHIRLLTNFMCRNNKLNPMSRFGMNINEYSFISRLSFEDPYKILHDVFYDIEDNLTSVSAKLITGIYDTENKL